uniref:Uncharacterized protein n=1 Tax=Rhizophora mucronata TaxID=61149 RepID=A0A2P2QJQ4_RHIMU
MPPKSKYGTSIYSPEDRH